MARSASSGLNPQVMPVWPHRSLRGLGFCAAELGHRRSSEAERQRGGEVSAIHS